MNTASRFKRVALAGTIAITGLLGATALAVAQDEPEFEPEYYESMLTGYEIEIGGSDFAIDDVIYQEYDDGENEQVYIESEFSSAQVSFFDDSDSPEDTIELWISDLGEGMDSLEVVDNGEDGDVVWYYAEGTYEDLDFVYYIQVTEDVDGNVDMLESVLTVEGELVNEIDAAQQDISVDGEAFMDDVDLDELEEYLDNGGTFRGSGDDSGTDDDSGSDDDSGTGDDSGTSGGDDEDESADDEDDNSSGGGRNRLPAGDDDDNADDSNDDTGNDTNDAGDDTSDPADDQEEDEEDSGA